MKYIVSVSFTSSALNFDTRFEFQGESFRISHYGCDFDPSVMKALLERFDGVADVIALQGLHPPVKVGRKIFNHVQSQEIHSVVKHSKVVTGWILGETYMPWALRAYCKKNPQFLSNRRVAFYSGLIDQALVEAVGQFTQRMTFLDPCLHLGIHKSLDGKSALDTYGKWVVPFLVKRPLKLGMNDSGKKFRYSGLASSSDIFVARGTLIERFELDHLSGKTLVVDSLSNGMIRQLQEAGVANILQFFPEIQGLDQSIPWRFSTLEAVLQCLKKDWEPLTEDEILNFINELDLKPSLRVLSTSKPKEKRRFAFIVHPLSIQDLFRHPAIRLLQPFAKRFEVGIENMLGIVPGVLYGKIEGIKSQATGEETEGLIYCVLDTPRMLMQKKPELTYDRLIRVCRMASEAHADIIGLGAYTKIVGDAGVTVANNSPIPVTTGNSLSAAATLWAAREACARMGFTPAFDRKKQVAAKAMVIGATGSIGAVCAKMLASSVDHVVICSRTADRLLELKEEILAISPKTKVTVVTNPNKEAESCDLIVTSTSSYDRKILDMMKVKPGCVICDVSRPLDIKAEDALLRPDVLVIESGEIKLPGNVKLDCDIGVPDSAVYACLAETALLSLEGRLESFTLSRHISYHKVREIYELARKHGAELAAIRGHYGIISTEEIDLCREHALKALKNRSKKESQQ